MEDTMHDDGKASEGKIMTAVHFPNPLFQDMSEEKNWSYSANHYPNRIRFSFVIIAIVHDINPIVERDQLF